MLIQDIDDNEFDSTSEEETVEEEMNDWFANGQVSRWSGAVQYLNGTDGRPQGAPEVRTRQQDAQAPEEEAADEEVFVGHEVRTALNDWSEMVQHLSDTDGRPQRPPEVRAQWQDAQAPEEEATDENVFVGHEARTALNDWSEMVQHLSDSDGRPQQPPEARTKTNNSNTQPTKAGNTQHKTIATHNQQN